MMKKRTNFGFEIFNLRKSLHIGKIGAMKLQLSPSALKVAQSRYLLRNEEGQIYETPEAMLERVAVAVAKAEAHFGDEKQVKFWSDKFEDLLLKLDFLPNSPTLMNAGTPQAQLSACFVLPIKDSLSSIFDTLKLTATVQQSGGGTGFSFSKLRPKGEKVSNLAGTASGPVSFMKIFDCATENIKQGGKRRGANMGILRIDHPDILDFIHAKREGGFENFNLSIAVTDDFMMALHKEEPFHLINPLNQKKVQEISAKEIFNEIVKGAWETGDPGLVFIDTIQRDNPTPLIGEIEATNPCGEVPLLPYEACNLGSVNLSHMVSHTSRPEILWEKLKKTIQVAVRFLDNVIEINAFPDEKITEQVRGNRKIGLGVMGFHEMLIQLGIPYNSEKAVTCASQLMKFVQDTAQETSESLAEERGVFPNWKKSRYFEMNKKLRNATCTSIAPTGTISILAGTSPSIEPIFALALTRKQVLGGQTLEEINPLLLKHVKNQNMPDTVVSALKQKGTIKDIPEFGKSVKELFATALEIAPEQHLKIQHAFQKHCDNAVSKTINLPQDFSEEKIAKLYTEAWKLGLKGITVFRYGCKPQVMELGVSSDSHCFSKDCLI
jgi:ribonucleoside-diphosphate reductase alpha chain